jgi:hypothetical protein
MRIPNRHRAFILLAIALLLAGITMGNISICDVLILGPPDQADTLYVNVAAGETQTDVARGIDSKYYLFRLCPPGAVSGVHPITHRLPDGNGGAIVSVDIATSTTTPPGHYRVNYTDSDFRLLFPFWENGILDLTVTPGAALVACYEYYTQTEFITAGIPVTFLSYCSTGPIVLYKWWFSYNGNPNSAPSTTTTDTFIETTLSAGAHTVRLVVRTATGQEAEISHTYTVVSP